MEEEEEVEEEEEAELSLPRRPRFQAFPPFRRCFTSSKRENSTRPSWSSSRSRSRSVSIARGFP